MMTSMKITQIRRSVSSAIFLIAVIALVHKHIRWRETFLKKALNTISFDYIIIDCRPTLGTLTVNALYAADFIIVPCEIGRYALDGFSDLMETIEKDSGKPREIRKVRARTQLSEFLTPNPRTSAGV